MYERTGTPDPALLRPWTSIIYNLSSTELDALRKCSSIRLTLTFKDGQTISYKLSSSQVNDWKNLMDLTSSSLVAPSVHKAAPAPE